jgi:hypothetical protein
MVGKDALEHVHSSLRLKARASRKEFSVKEQEIGRQCYEAEEDLSQLELGTLKRALGINDTRWRAFKAKFIEGSSPEELA